MKCVIIAGGPMEGCIESYDLLICADGGIRHADRLGIFPHYIIGDMDSSHPELLRIYQEKGSKLIRFPKDKDQVDTELALQLAIDHKAKEILIYGGLGDRLDHTLANIHLLSAPASKGIKAFLLDQKHRISLVTPDSVSRVSGKGKIFSLLPLSGRAEGVNVRGSFWELENAVFETNKPYGVSNKVASDFAEITVREGILILCEVELSV